MEQKASDKLLGVENDGLFTIAIFAIAVAQSDLALVDGEDAIVGERHTVGVAAKIVENGLGRAERLFRIDDPIFVMWDADVVVDFPSSTSLS